MRRKLWNAYILTILLLAILLECVFCSMLIYNTVNEKNIEIWLSLIFSPVLALSRFYPTIKKNINNNNNQNNNNNNDIDGQ